MFVEYEIKKTIESIAKDMRRLPLGSEEQLNASKTLAELTTALNNVEDNS